MTSSSPRTLRANVSWTLVSNIVYGLYQWLLIAIIANLSGASSVGAFSLALAVVGPIQLTFNLQLRALLASDAKGDFPFRAYLQLRVMGVFLTAVVVISVILVGLVSSELLLPVFGVLAIKSVEGVSDIVYGWFQREERLDISSKSRLAESLVGLATFTIVFAITESLFLSLMSVACGLVAVLVLFTLPQQRVVSAKLHRDGQRVLVPMSTLIGLISLGIPLGITMGISSAAGALPRIVLDRFADTESVGVYAGISQLVISGVILTGAIGQALTPRLSKFHAEGNATGFFWTVRRMVAAGFLIGTAGTLVSIVVGEKLLLAVYTSEFAEHSRALVMMAFSTIFLFGASFQGYALTAARIIRSQVVILLLVFLSSLVSLLVFVPKWGVEGAAAASIVSSFVQFIASFVFLKVKFSGVHEDGNKRDD